MIDFFRRALFMLVLLVILIASVTAIVIVHDGLRDQISKSDVAIILGSKVNADGILSNRLVARLNKGIALYQLGLVTHIIVSSGKARGGVDEATAMKQYLLNHQIPASAIIADSHGYNTADTAKNSVAIMQAQHFKTAIIVSQYFHITRTRLAFKQCGISPVYNAHARFFELRDFYSIAREVVAYYAYRFLHPACNS